MELLLLLLGPGAVFAMLAVSAKALSGPRGALVVAMLWVAVLSTHVVASLPSHDVQVHSFERSPAMGIAATLAGTIAGVGLVSRSRGSVSRHAVLREVVLALQVGGAYAVTSLAVGILTFVFIAG